MAHTFDEYAQQWQDAYNRGDFAAVAAQYTEDAVFFNFDGRRTEGRKAIQESLKENQEQISSQAPGVRIHFESKLTEQEEFGNAGHLLGTYKYTVPDGKVLMEGYFAILGRKVGDDWKIARHMSTAHVAVPAEAKKMAAV